jgi:RNA polymerase-associated protein CTR9
MATAMTTLANGHTNGDHATSNLEGIALRFSDIPSAIDIPVSGLDTEEAVEVNLEDHLEDPSELCQLLENEKAAKNLWLTISLAYAKQQQVDYAITILENGLNSLAKSATSKDKLSVHTCLAWLHLLKSRHAPRVAPESSLISDVATTKDHYLNQATQTINDALRINPAFQPLFLTRGILFLLKASLQSSSRTGGTASDTERTELLRQAQKWFEEALKTSGGRNMMALMGRSRTQYLMGRYADALHGYQEVLGKVPGLTDPDPRIGIGCCLWQLGFHDRAKMAWERSLALQPNSKQAHALLGIYYLHESARYPATDPQFNALYKKAMIDHTKKAYTIDKDFPLSCATFASYFLLTGRYETVEPLARKAIEQTDVNAIASDGWYLLARKGHNKGELQKASDFYNRADQARGGLEKGYLPAKFGMIQVMVQMNDFDGAKFRLEKLTPGKKNLEAMTLLGCLHAEEVFETQSSLGPVDKANVAKKAINLLESVRKAWNDETSKATPDESVLLYLSRLYEVDQPLESMKCLQMVEALQLEKIPAEDRPVVAESDDKGAEFLSQLRQFLPPQLLNNMACFLYGAEQYNLARDTFQTALNACVKMTKKQEAEKQHVEEGAMDESDVDTTDTDALATTISYNLARTYEVLGLAAEAKAVYDELLARHSDYTDATARLAYMALRSSPQNEGPRKVQAVYQSDYGDLEVRALMGWYHSRSKRKALSEKEDLEYRQYKHTLQGHDKHDRYSLVGMGNILLANARDMPRNNEQEKEKRSKQYQRAVEFFDKALQLDPKNAYAAQGIAIALCDDKKEYSTAVQIFTKCKDTLRDTSIYVNLGHVYTELRQYQRGIENYETALKRDNKENAILLACLSRAWLLKGKADKSITSLNTALEYMHRALATQSDSPHLQFNIAFLQFQIAQQVNSTADADRTLEDVHAAAEGLEEAIVTFEKVAKVKQPPYPKSALEQRAAMAKNTMRKQLERAERSQKDYEEQNQEKLKAAKERREEELRRRDEASRRKQEEVAERTRKIAEERRKIIEDTEKMAEQLRAEQMAREAAEYTDDEETGQRVKRKPTKRSGGGKRKKRDDDDGFIEDDGDGRSERTVSRTPASGSEDNAEKSEKPKKRRKLERKGGAARKAPREPKGKFKSDALIIDSDSDSGDVGSASAVATPATGEDNTPEPRDAEMRDAGGDGDDEAPQQSGRRKQVRRIADEDEDEEDEAGDGSVNVNMAGAALAAMSDDDE